MNKRIRERRELIMGMGLSLQRVEYRRKHVAFVCDEGILFCGATPSDRREVKNFRSVARRLGRQ
jgi:hypothetical protein